MVTPPIGPTPNYPGASIWGPHPKATRPQERTSSNSETDPSVAIHDSNELIGRAQQAVQEAQAEASASIQHIQDGYQEQSQAENVKSEDVLQKQRLHGYEALRDLKRSQEAELSRVRREGETNLSQSNEYCRDTLYKTSERGDAGLKDLQLKQFQQQSFADTSGKMLLDQTKSNHAKQVDELKQSQDEQVEQLTAAQHDQMEKLKEGTEAASLQETAKFQGDYKHVMDEDQRVIGNLQNEASEQIKNIRQDTAQKLAAYGARQNDPFYKMMDMNAELRDEGDHFVLTANIPSHEQQHVSVQVQGNTIVLSGNRRNEEKLDLGEGRARGTSAYQSFQESFPLSWPVEKNQLTKEFQGDTLTITVPKANGFAYHDQYQAPEPKRARVERPQFPGNLPLPEPVAQNTNPDGTRKSPRGGTLA
jgi:HSP20 family molecular chaperone IbpA